MLNKIGKSLQIALMIFTAAILILSLAGLGYFYSQYRQSDKLYHSLEEKGRVKRSLEADSNHDDEKNAYIDHESLKSINPDYIGWIEVEGTQISYPVVFGKDNYYYLNHLFDNSKGIAGTIFMDMNNSQDLSDTNTVIYGHHMKDGTMFNELTNFLDKDFFAANKMVSISTPDGDKLYEIFACYEVHMDLLYFNPGKLDRSMLHEYVSFISSNARQQTDTAVEPDDRILSLMTCGWSFKGARIVINARFIEE